jgi:hypothetical protein
VAPEPTGVQIIIISVKMVTSLFENIPDLKLRNLQIRFWKIPEITFIGLGFAHKKQIISM